MIHVYILVPSIISFLALATYNLSQPGYYYDEALFYNASVGAPTDLFVYKRLLHVPVMLMPYIGALKAWIHAPIFLLFGTGYWSMRLPSIIIVTISIIILYMSLLKLFGSTIARVALVLITVNPALIFHARLDWGPTALMFLFRNLLLFHCIQYHNTRRFVHLIFISIFFLAGLFDKLNFIWFAVSIFFVTLTLYNHRVTAVLSLYLIVLFICVAMIIHQFGARYFHFTPDLSTIVYSARQFTAMIKGTAVYELVFMHPVRSFMLEDIFLIAFVLSIIVSTLYRAPAQLGQTPKIENTHLLLFCALLLTQILITRQATGPHHYAVLVPLLDISCAIGIVTIAHCRKARLLSALVFFSVITYRLFVNTSYLIAFSSSVPSPYWDKYIDDLSIFIHTTFPRTAIITADWGLAANIQAASQNHFSVYEFWPWFNEGLSSSQETWLIDTFMTDQVLLLRHVSGREAFPNTTFWTEHLLANPNVEKELVTTFATEDHIPYVELWKLSRRFR